MSNLFLAWCRTVPDKLRKFVSRRSLLGEILTLQLGFAVIVGVLAFGGLQVSSGWVAEANTHKWGQLWLSTIDDISMPLYTSEDEDRFIRVEDYVKRFPEISFVRFYSPAGEILFAEVPRPLEYEIPLIAPSALITLASDRSGKQNFMFEDVEQNQALKRIATPIWTESMAMDGLLGFDPANEAVVQKILVGYVELGLDSREQLAALRENIRSGVVMGTLVLVLMIIASWFIYRRALLPLSQLQKPLRKLAEGQTNFTVELAGHTEIMSIGNALNTAVTALKDRDEKLTHLANYDSLTGLINRQRFAVLMQQEFEKAATEKTDAALLFIDLDQFKYVNDTVGHGAGDQLLRLVADRLRNGVRQSDYVSRFGGDEFVILLCDVSRKMTELICEQLVASLGEHRFVENGESFSISCSIGVRMVAPGEYQQHDLLAQADMACHQAKSRGRNRFDFYKASSNEINAMATEMGWSRKIHQALKEDSFFLHYQPIFDIATHEPAHYEVLLRMVDDDGSLIPPDGFISAASRFGLMADIDRWVIRNSLEQLANFRKAKPEACFTLNISGSMFDEPDLSDFLQSNLDKHGLSLDSIVLEITEQVAVRTMGAAGKRIEELADRGCKFALDDFGAGYSSYSYLKTLPVDFIKIDGAFISNIVNDEVDQKIVSSIIEIARATGKQTIAEHVADYETFELLRQLGVDFAQGYFVGEPTDTLTVRTIPASMAAARKRRRGKAS